MAFLTGKELQDVGFKSLGKNVLISDKASIYGAQYISVGDFGRVDDFCILSAGKGGISIGRNVHISCYVSLIGQAEIVIGDFSSISGKCAIYSSSDDFSGAFLTGPTVGSSFNNVTHAPVLVGRHCIVGTGSVLLPGIVLEQGVAVGALSLVTSNCEAFSIYVGTPAKRIKERRRDLLELEEMYMKTNP